MSCKNCEEFQKSDMTSFIRWKNANIEIRGCREHVKEIMEVIKKATTENFNKECK